ncbi:hypothetical protein SCUCBS95973_003162 [Sporothrix curviconia]|uniref:Uncharacterized protein n=1 Tax=Sporothrix curviconia TaxID=1260050 RepID=A0ABP0BCV0_9PEZI
MPDSVKASPFPEIPSRSLPAEFAPSASPLPVPALEPDFRLVCNLAQRIPVGPTPTGGQRNWIGIADGWFAGRWGAGVVVPGGQDNQVVTPDLSTKIDTQCLLKTDDAEPAYITVHTEGWRTGDAATLAKLFDPAQADGVQPSEYKFRLYVHLETGDARYKELCTGMWVASGARLGAKVLYDAYRIQ